jgi:hypothetical protein
MSQPDNRVEPVRYDNVYGSVRALFEDTERAAAAAGEQLVGTAGFAEFLGLLAGNMVALVKIGGDVADLTLRNLRLAGRADVARLERQLSRTEDKLELVLQEVESLRDELAEARTGEQTPRPAAVPGGGSKAAK